MKSITTRWLRGSLLITLVVLAVAEALYMYSTYQSYYGGARQTIISRFSTLSGQLQATGTAGDSDQTAASRASALRRAVEQFSEKDKFEFMLLDSAGGVITASSGTQPEGLTGQEDFVLAQTAPSGVGSAVYHTGEGERVLSVTMLVPYAAGSITALRMVTSMTLVDRRIWQAFAMSMGVALAVLCFTVWSGLFFVRSIVKPLGQVEATATKIAKGDLSVRLPATRYNDEIGRLCATINQMAQDLAMAETMKNDFISSVSHELRTPLTSIKGWVETIATLRDPADPNYQKGISIIGTETDRLYTMVEELLDFSRLQNGIQLKCQVLDLVAETTDAALFVEARIQKEGLRLVYDEPEFLCPVWADPGRLHQVLVNVLDNAIKYSEPGGSITITLERRGPNAVIAVRDHGRGISPEDLANVKQKFFKGKNAVRGSGIGLAVVEEIVSALGGTLDMASTLGVGTTVSMALPIYHPGQEFLHQPIQ
ncbi:MAG: HAMP domain-containing sensor histidine kinase [Gemmiger sp.]|nr:HAMP domain-containing sensor histidine kinase [Gemmiger sp.]